MMPRRQLQNLVAALFPSDRLRFHNLVAYVELVLLVFACMLRPFSLCDLTVLLLQFGVALANLHLSLRDILSPLISMQMDFV